MEDFINQTKKRIDFVKEKHANGEKLSPLELDDFCLDCTVSQKSFNNLPSICDDLKFKKLYLIYFSDLTFKSEYVMPNFGAQIDYKKAYKKLTAFGEQESKKEYFDADAYSKQRQIELEFGIIRKVTPHEVLNDKSILEKYASEWNSTINITNHKNQYLQVISKEARNYKKLITKRFETGEINDSQMKHQIDLILWKTKHIHLSAERIIEEFKNYPYILNLNSVKVHFTYTSLIHILNRHYGELVSIQMFQVDKSFHNPIFQPNKIHLILEIIFNKLSAFYKFQSEKIAHNKAYNFQFKKINYQLYLKSFGEKKDLLFVSSLYPLTDLKELLKLKKFKLYKLDDDLIVYIKQPVYNSRYKKFCTWFKNFFSFVTKKN